MHTRGWIGWLIFLQLMVGGCRGPAPEHSEEPAAAGTAADPSGVSDPPAEEPWQVILGPDDDRDWQQSLDDWRVTAFGGEGEIEIENDRVVMEFGSPLTGLTYAGTPPTGDYELEVSAARLEGSDFFLGLTFPVGDSHCSLILGGWGGALTGLSCIDELDASSNDTTQFHDFETGREFATRLQVSRDSIRVFLDGTLIIDQPLQGRRVSIRPEVDLSRPLGVACFNTRAAIGRLRWRPLRRSGV